MKLLRNLFTSVKEEFQEPETLLLERSPNCPIEARVEQDNRVVYFYLTGIDSSNFPLKTCWIRNLVPAPEEDEFKLMEKGVPPLLPKEFCRYPEGQSPLDKNNLSLIWFEEGDAAALVYDTEIIAIIPSWGGVNNFTGYSVDCIKESNYSWVLEENNELLKRAEQSGEFWHSWEDEKNPFQIMQPMLLNLYEQELGKSDRYFAIDNNEWPPKGLYLREGEAKNVFVTVGLSLLPQPIVEMYTEYKENLNRIEMGLILNSNSNCSNEEVAKWMSSTTTIPWQDITWLGEGHTVTFNGFNHPNFKSVLLTSNLDILPKFEINPFRGSKINLLWMIPITTNERKFIMDFGSQEFIALLNDIGEGVYSLDRKELI